jgi:Cdc6-like AAA superfamily ATPase
MRKPCRCLFAFAIDLPMNSETQVLADWIVPPLDNVVYLTGPTGSGKTQVALELAESLEAEIVSVDSMAVIPMVHSQRCLFTLAHERRILRMH